MRGEIRGWEIPAEDILPYAPNTEVECIIMGLGTAPEAAPDKHHFYGKMLINGFIRFIYELAAKGVTITKFYATSATPTGIALLEGSGFQKTGQIGKRIVFELDTMTSSAPFAIRYREMLGKSE